MASEGWRQGQRDDLSLPQLANMLWGRRALVGACVLVFVIVAVAVGFFQGATSVAGATLSVRPDEGRDDETDPEVLVREVMDSVATPELSREAMRRAGWRAGVSEFNEGLDVEPTPNGREIQVKFSAGTPEAAVGAANAYARAFAARVEELGQRRLAGGTLAAEARVNQGGHANGGSHEGPLLYGTVAGAGGLVLGGAVALLLESRTRKWRGARDAELTLRAPVLGTIPHSGAEEKGWLTRTFGTRPVPEARRFLSPDPPLGPRFGELARNFLSLPWAPRSVVVTSPEHEAGCSSVCLGLGSALARTGTRVAIFDCNVDRPHLHRLFGRPNFTGLTNALEGTKPPGDYAFDAAPGLDVVPTGPVVPGSGVRVGSRRLVRAVRDSGYDVVLLDAPVADEVLESPVFSGGFDGVLLVVHAARTPKSLARQVTDDLLDAGVNLLGVVLNGEPASAQEKDQLMETEAANHKDNKGRRVSQRLQAFKTFVLVALMVITAYGILNRGLFGEERWTPVAGFILGLLFVTLFVDGFYADISRAGWILVGLLAALVAIKGLSLTWSISPIETVEELLRSSMYLATFAMALAALSARRLVPAFVDGLNVMVGLVAGYGILQKINPVTYPPRTLDGVRIGSSLDYPNTVAVILGMGIALGLGRMTQLTQPVARGLYAAALLVFSTALYFTFSRGGILALGVGLVVLFVLSEKRLQMFANLLLFSAPLLWLVQRAQGLDTLFETKIPAQDRLADGAALRTDVIIALVAAFLLQAFYALLIERYELTRTVHRVLGAAAIAVVVVGMSALAYVVLSEQVGSGGIMGAFTEGVGAKKEGAGVNERLTSLSSNQRSAYWSVAWEEWKEHPLTGTGAGTYLYTWLENRPNYSGVRQVHNVYLEQGTETGVFAFLALTGFAVLLGSYLARASFRASGDRRILLAALSGAVAVYLFHSAFEWHWYIPPSTIFFFVIAGAALKFAFKEDWDDEKRPAPTQAA